MTKLYKTMGRMALSAYDREVDLAAHDYSVEAMNLLEPWLWLAIDCSLNSREVGEGGAFE